MTTKVEIYHYKFSDVILTGKRAKGRDRTNWYIQCPECGGEHNFRKLGRKIWVAHCVLFSLEWTITPAEYYLKKPADFSIIMGRD